eukprot:COSAG02_NODE_1010_length_15227_cov_5.846774_13_plen_85_part_00
MGRDQAEQKQGESAPLGGVLSVTCGGYHTIATVAIPKEPRTLEAAYPRYVWSYGGEGQLALVDPPMHSVLVPQLLPQAPSQATA